MHFPSVARFSGFFRVSKNHQAVYFWRFYAVFGGVFNKKPELGTVLDLWIETVLDLWRFPEDSGRVTEGIGGASSSHWHPRSGQRLQEGISRMARAAGHRQGRQGGQGGSFILSLACRHPRQCFARPCPCLCRQPDAAAIALASACWHRQALALCRRLLTSSAWREAVDARRRG